jgi:hypothetical protein
LIARVAVLCLAAAAASGCAFWRAPQVGAGFAAKITCSLQHNSGQDPRWVIDEYVRYESPPLASLVSVEVEAAGSRARLLGLWRGEAVVRPGLGCTLLHGAAPVGPQGGIAEPQRRLDPATPWPQGDAPPPPAPAAIEAALDRAFAEPDREEGRVRHTTAVVIAHRGRLVAERYAEGYDAMTPMLSWSMAKSVIASLVAVEIGDGRLALQGRAPVPEWSSPDDPRHAITLDQLLRMSSGLAWDETYGAVNDVARMLFTRPDAGAFAAAKPLAFPPDTHWSYSSGTSNIVARIFRDLHGGDVASQVRFARERFFDPIDVTSAIFEPDASGGFIGSSFVFLTARDWARFVELHRNDGVWNGRRVLPEGWVRYVTRPTPKAPKGEYGAHWWLNAGAPGNAADRMWPKLPPDTYAATGHNGQYALVVPSADLVIVRLGLSLPDGDDVGLEDLVLEAMAALGSGETSATGSAPSGGTGAPAPSR